MRFLVLGLALILPAGAQMTISVSNAGGRNDLHPSSVAPGSMISIRRQLREGPIRINPDLSRLALRIQPESSGSNFTGTPLAANAFEVLALLPAEVPPGSANIVLIEDGAASNPAQVTVVPNSIALFTQARNGLGPALALNEGRSAPPKLNQLMNPVLSGEYVSLWGTGLGRATLSQVAVEFGGKRVNPTYAGPAPGFAGLDQINFPVPADALDGCYVSVRVKAGDSTSNEVMIAKASRPGACEHPFRLPEEDLRALDAGRGIPFGMITMRSDIAPPFNAPLHENIYTRNESAAAEFRGRDALSVSLFAQPLETDEQYFGCELWNPAISAVLVLNERFDAGEILRLTGPDKMLELVKQEQSLLTYSAPMAPPPAVADPRNLPPAFFTGGLWQVSGAGGATAAPFTESVTLPRPIRWTNRDDFTNVDRGRDQTVLWLADGYSVHDIMTVTLSNRGFTDALPPGSRASAIQCRARASEGKVTIPASLLREIPVATSGPGGTLELRLAPRPTQRKQFSLALTDGGSLPVLIEYQYTETLRAPIR